MWDSLLKVLQIPFFAPYTNLHQENVGYFKSFVLLSNNLPFVDIYGRQSFPLLVPETLILEQNLAQESDL